MLTMITNCFLALRDIINSRGDFELLTSKETKSGAKESDAAKQEKRKRILDNIDEKTFEKFDTKNLKLTLNLNINLDVGTSREAIEELFKNISLAHGTVFGENK
jgi:hypothetical protein